MIDRERGSGAVNEPTAPLHVGITSPRVSPGGLNRFVDQLRAAQRSAGSDARLIALGDERSSDGAYYVAPLGANLISRSMALRSGILEAASSSDVIDVHFALNALPALLAPRIPVPPVVTHFHGPWALESADNGARPATVRVRRRIERAVFRRTSAFITLTEAFRRLLVERYDVPSELVHVVPPGVDHRRFSPGDQEEARSELGLATDRPIVASVRRLVPRMGLTDLLDATKDLDVDVVIVGDGPMRAELVSYADDLGMSRRVHFLTSIADAALPSVYRAADLSVIPTRSLEGFGLVALESLACGTPVVARAQGGLVEALRGFDRALVADSSTDALREAVATMLAQPVTSAECVDYTSSRTWAATAARTETIYRTAIEAQR